MPIVTLIFWRNLGGSLMTLPFLIRNRRSLDRAGVIWSMRAGFVLAMHFIGFFIAMRFTSVAAGTALVALQPIFASWFVKLTGGHIPQKAWIGMSISLCGVVLISGIDFSLDKRSFTGDIAAMISAALAALYMLWGARALKTIEATSYMTICYFTCAITALPIVLVIGQEVLHFPSREWWILFGLIIGAQMLGHSMFNSALKRVSPAIVSLIVFFEVPVAALIAWIFNIGKEPSSALIPGVAIILIGCTIVVMQTRPSKEITNAEVLE
jgi:drug/metabolite transporter (DMT)-like permease